LAARVKICQKLVRHRYIIIIWLNKYQIETRYSDEKVIDVESMQERMKTLNCVDLDSPEALEAGSPHPANMFTNANNNLLFPEKEDLGAHSDSECLDRSSAWMDVEEKHKVL